MARVVDKASRVADQIPLMRLGKTHNTYTRRSEATQGTGTGPGAREASTIRKYKRASLLHSCASFRTPGSPPPLSFFGLLSSFFLSDIFLDMDILSSHAYIHSLLFSRFLAFAGLASLSVCAPCALPHSSSFCFAPLLRHARRGSKATLHPSPFALGPRPHALSSFIHTGSQSHSHSHSGSAPPLASNVNMDGCMRSISRFGLDGWFYK